MVEGWKNRRIENEELIEKWENRRDFVFSHTCLVGRMEKYKDKKKLIYLIEKKNEMVENKIAIN